MDFAYFLWLSEIKWINVDPQNFMEKRVSFVNDLQICTLPCIVSTFDSYWNSVIVSIILRMNNSPALWMWMLLLRIHSSLIRLRLFDISLGCGALCCTRTVFEEDWFHSRKRYFFLSCIEFIWACRVNLISRFTLKFHEYHHLIDLWNVWFFSATSVRINIIQPV